jgi:hypothetical protein
MRDLGGDMVAPEFLWQGPIYGCANLPINNGGTFLEYYGSSMYYVWLQPSYGCAVQKYSCATYLCHGEIWLHHILPCRHRN